MRHGTPIGDGLRMAVYPIRPKKQKVAGERCPLCERKYTKKREAVVCGVGTVLALPVRDGLVRGAAEDGRDRLPLKHPVAIVLEDTVNWRGDYWERSLHPSEARYKKALEVDPRRLRNRLRGAAPHGGNQRPRNQVQRLIGSPDNYRLPTSAETWCSQCFK